MAEALCETRKISSDIVIGSQLIDVVTCGMYNDPLMVLREYVQNAVDSLDVAFHKNLLGPGEGKVEISIDGINREISVTDNGAGIPAHKVPTVLCSLGCSTKDRYEQRGFRGIGRLGGLGYCDQVLFETKASGEEHVSVVTWDGKKLLNVDTPGISRVSAQKAVEGAVTVTYRSPGEGEREHFFRATMKNVHRFHRDELMNLKTVATFLSRVSPVEYDEKEFEFATEIREHVSKVPGYRTYNVLLNGEPIYKPHATLLSLGEKKSDVIKRVEFFQIQTAENHVIGCGWYAITNFLSALPSQVGMRGIRLRQGNIEVGDEYSLADLYSERRFATWHIGEIHLDYSVKANARRDSFEHSKNYEVVLEQINFLCRRLSAVCRQSSKRRGKEKAAETAIERLEGLARLKVIIDQEDLHRAVDQAELRLRQLASVDATSLSLESLRKRLAEAKLTLNCDNDKKAHFFDLLDGRTLRFAEPRKVLRDIAKAVVASYDGSMSRERLLSIVFEQYLKKGALEELMQG